VANFELFAHILVQRGWGRGTVPSLKKPRPESVAGFGPWFFFC
jgi:hypothetical protein